MIAAMSAPLRQPLRPPLGLPLGLPLNPPVRLLVAHSEPGAGRAWRDALLARLPGAEVTIDPGTPDGAGPDGAPPGFVADWAVGWGPPADLFARQPTLRGFFSSGAGVDHLLRHPGLPATLPLIRLEDAGMGELMADYCLHELLRIAGRHDVYAAQQARAHWHEQVGFTRAELPVGVLGVGVLGAQVAQHLARAGFTVRGFARGPKLVDGVEVMHGASRWQEFLGATRVLILLAPRTAETEDLIDAAALARLRPGGWLINVARGALVVDADLVAALDAGTLAGATLDVFREEPLPASHPFWHHPRIRMTPHSSAPTQVAVSAAQVAAKLAAIARGEPVGGLVDRVRGY
jgi:glyoxylate/hydroxypyruvate reductase